MQGKALRRVFGVEESFEEKPWQKYTEESQDDFMDFLAFRITFSPLIDLLDYQIFMMMDVNGVGMVNVWDAQKMIRDMDLAQYSGPDGIKHAIRDLLEIDQPDDGRKVDLGRIEDALRGLGIVPKT